MLICRDFYGAVDGLCEPTDADSMCIQTDLFGEWGLSNDIKKQFLMGKDYSTFNGDTLEGYLDD